MKRKGKTNKTLAGLDAFSRHGFERYGDKFATDYAPAVQFVGFTKQFVLDLERDADPEIRARADYWWKRQLEVLQSELRNAMLKKDGSFFRALANCVEGIGETPVDPLREWICRLHIITNGVTIQEHQDKTSDELYIMFITEEKLPEKERPSLELFTKTLREMNVKWKKRPGGPKSHRPK